MYAYTTPRFDRYLVRLPFDDGLPLMELHRGSLRQWCPWGGLKKRRRDVGPPLGESPQGPTTMSRNGARMFRGMWTPPLSLVMHEYSRGHPA